MNDFPLPVDYRGLITSLDPSKAPSGSLVRALNARNDDGTSRARDGITLVDSSGLATTYKGGAFFEYDGNVYYFFAMDNGGASPDTHIYYSVYNGSVWSGPTQLTSSSGQYGSTALQNPASGFVTFTGVPGIYGTKYIVVQNGVNNPVVITLGGSPVVAPNVAVEPPIELSNNNPTWTVSDYLDIMDTSGGAVVVTVVSGSGLSGTATGTPQYWQFASSGSGVADGDIVQIRMTTDTVDCSNSNQIWIVGDSDDDAFLYGFKWSIRDSSGNLYVIHDPENGRDNVTVVETNIAGTRIYAFPIGEHTRTASLNAIDGLRLEAQNAAVGVSQNLNIRAILASGKVPAFAQYAISLQNTGTQAESPSVVLPNPVEGDGLAGIFGSDLPSLDSGFKLPIAQGLEYLVKVPTIAPATTERDKGVDYTNIYRKDPDDADFYFINDDQVSSYSAPNWGYASPYTSSALRQLFSDTVDSASKDTTKTAPGAYVESIPVGQAGAFSSDRMYFSSRGGSSAKPSVKVSDVKFPFRFRSLPLSGEEGLEGFEAVLDGERDITAIIPSSSSTIGAAGVYVFTKQGVYTIDGVFVAKVSTAGCLGAVAEDDTTVYFFDKDKQVRMLSGGIPNLSRYTVHDKFKDISDPSTMSFARFQGRLYSKNSGTQIMVWSDRLQAWESEDVPHASLVPAQFLKWNFFGESKLYVAMTDGDLYEYESGTTDDSNEIALGITWPQMHDENYSQIRVGNPYIVCDDKASETGTFTLTAQNPASTQTATVNLDAPSGETATWTKAANSGKDIVVRGCAVTVKFDCTTTAPFKIYSVRVKSNVNAGRGARA